MRKPRGSLLTGQDVDRFCRDLEAHGCTVERDADAGTVVGRDGEHVVFRAVEKGRGQPWLGIFVNAGRIAWLKPEEV